MKRECKEGEKMSLVMNWLEGLSYEVKAADHCLRNFSPFSTCTLCKDSCEVQAISYSNRIPIMNNQSCDLCGRCVTLCPVQAIEGRSPSRKIINKILILDDGPLPTVNELLRLHTHEIRNLYITVPNQQLLNIVKETNILLIQMKESPFEISKTEDSKNLEQAKLSRREFFNKLSFESKKLAAATITPVKWRQNHGEFRRSDLFPDWAFTTIELNQEKCTLCEACFRLCPEEVFSIQEGKLNVITGKCTGCSLCVDVCHYDGLKIEPNVCEARTVSIPIRKSKCKTCGDSFLSWKEEESCFICNSRKANHYL
jgi:ferredoxin